MVVPLILLTAWAAAVPAVTAERLGPIRALTRSWQLTSGKRWPLFGGFVVVFVALLSCACVVSSISAGAVVGVAVAGGALADDPGRLMSSMAIVQAINLTMQGVLYSVLLTGCAVSYHQLRVAAEGPGPSQLARVFE